MGFTPETLAKAQATRRARAAERKQAAIDKRDGVQRVLDSVSPRVKQLLKDTEDIAASKIVIVRPPGSWWDSAPLAECITALADMKRAYDSAAAIVLARSATTTPTHTCWTQHHKDTVPVSVQRLCKKIIPDGRWASRDDAVFKTVDGIRIPDPVFCCNATCHEYYLRSKQPSALSRH